MLVLPYHKPCSLPRTLPPVFHPIILLSPSFCHSFSAAFCNKTQCRHVIHWKTGKPIPGQSWSRHWWVYNLFQFSDGQDWGTLALLFHLFFSSLPRPPIGGEGGKKIGKIQSSIDIQFGWDSSLHCNCDTCHSVFVCLLIPPYHMSPGFLYPTHTPTAHLSLSLSLPLFLIFSLSPSILWNDGK